MSSRKVRSITGVIEFDDGEKVEILLGEELDSRWGNTPDVLGDAVEPCEVIVRALVDEGLLAREEDDDA